ncbi:hypothetical protein SSP24_60710 [Streptomyces spinoverrucosus]|uniref:DUF304 domain-containing protein n=1 Tax=Streptomyces spinoverrucosus TaxID=284043 RepID=A0A4Y3VTZ7_9ACTN|nr:hypothetical protein [Streptomyces spinoverrucosus]GEC08416.1 hypothetical protein SSP24_60710 [Streptomyces spinoverrucosus]GHB94779.1 hypothetical protein GCM10010397_79430 [Streptomyces spinoverrucosus]
MGTEQSVRCKVPYYAPVVVGFSLVWLGGLVVLGFRWLRHDPTHPGEFLLVGGLLTLTVCIGLLRRRSVVRAVEFTKAQVRLESRAGVRTVPIADLRAVGVEHTGTTVDGYVSTSLRLDWRDESRSFDCSHDPTLGEALVRLLPSRVTVEERWDELQEPSTG